MKTEPKTREQHLDANFAAFKKVLPEIINQHYNEYALIRNGKIENFYSTPMDAYVTGERFFPDEVFSIQKVSTAKLDLGTLTHVGYLREV